MKNVKVSTLGFGFMGKLHTISYKSMPYCYDNFQYNIKLDKLLTTKDINTISTGYNSHVNSILDLKDVDIIDICTPNFMHKDQINEAILSGIKNIYCEKPITGIYDEEKEIVKMAKDKSINNQVGLVLRFLPVVIRTKKIIEEGVIGDIINFNAHIYHESYLNSDRPISWRLEKSKSGGGALIDLGIHIIDLIQYILGPITQTEGYTKTFINKRPSENGIKNVDVDDFAHLDVVVNKKTQGCIEVSRVFASGGEDTSIVIYGTKGSINLNTKNPESCFLYILSKNAWLSTENYKFKDSEDDIKFFWPIGKFSLGTMVNSHMASLFCFISRINGKTFNFIEPPTFESSASALKVIDDCYNSIIK